ncbi:uncharacterized protein LOC143125565 isoform X3 [Alosa pseudoharengus]|uniref:uncharacterized protein LOC143125565 isoform X3 n=1 Tax=Alosa pseudoharengus TaxID=34774 RepID=UPI003F893944
MCVLLPQMRAFAGFVVLLVTSTYGLDSMCDATQNAACYGALGGPVYLQLMRDTRGHYLNLLYGHTAVFRFRRSKPMFYKEFNTTSVLQRWQFVPHNGTMIINPAERRDAGTYRVQITEEAAGKTVGDHTVQLIIEAPVSDVDLSISCSANGERSVRCSSNGDSPQYSWSVDGRPLGEADADLSSDNQTLLLRGDVTGQLTCSLRNHVSSTHTTRLMELCSGLDSICDVTQNAACYGALGGPVYLQLIEDTRGCELKIYRENKRAFTFRKTKPGFHDEFNTPSVLQRWQFVPDNGTMIINPAERRDAGTYRVVIYASTGTSVGQHTVQLTIEAPVSDMDLSISCSANGERSVRCSSNGDSIQYSWSLDGRPLGETDADVSSDNQTLLLRGDVTGQLTCSVRNHVSSTHTTPLLFGCSGGISPVFISVWLAEIIIFTSLLVGGYYLYIRNRTSHTPGGGADAVTPHWSRGGAAPDYSSIPRPL